MTRSTRVLSIFVLAILTCFSSAIAKVTPTDTWIVSVIAIGDGGPDVIVFSDGELMDVQSATASGTGTTEDGTGTSTFTGSGVWNSAYSGTVTGAGTASVTGELGSVGGHTWLFYEFELDQEYSLEVRWSLFLTSGVYGDGGIQIDSAGEVGFSPNQGYLARTLGPGVHTLELFLGNHNQGPSGTSVTSGGHIQWRLDGCEDDEPTPISSDPNAGIVNDYECPVLPQLKDEWTDDGDAAFREYCVLSVEEFRLRYFSDKSTASGIGDPSADSDFTTVGGCRWSGGMNYANIFYGGDLGVPATPECFISSIWRSREPDELGLNQGVPGFMDRCVYNFTVKSLGGPSIQHQVMDGGWRDITPGERLRNDLYGWCDTAPIVRGTADPMGGEDHALCDDDLDGDCDTEDNDAFVAAVGRCAGDAQYQLLYDVDRDGCVGEHDIRRFFPYLDFDEDGYTNYEDNCFNIVNDQTDFDDDGVGDLCDCAPSDDSAFATPKEIRDVTVMGTKSTITWASDELYSGDETVYDVLRGSLAELPAGSGAAESCVELASTDTLLHDIDEPSVGRGFYYLVRAVNNCGIGIYGYQSNGTERVATACP